MWHDMEEARKIAFEAQSLSAHCQQLCAQSEEETMRMRQDIKKSLGKLKSFVDILKSNRSYHSFSK